MVVLATLERAAVTAYTVSAPTSPSWASSSRVASRIACRERAARRSGVCAGAVVGSVTPALYYET